MRFVPFLFLAAGFALLACTSTPNSQPSSPSVERGALPHLAGPAIIDGTTRYLIDSKNVDQVFAIDVWRPLGTTGPLPVVYVLDGNTSFGMVSNMYMPMMFAGAVPPAIVVGIGYQIESPMEIVGLRSRDLLPTPEAGFEERMAGAGFPLRDGVRPGGADAFLAFIETELKPMIAARYEVDDENETLVGYSYGGTFAFHVLISRTSAFERYVIGSPVLARDDGELIADEAAHAADSASLDATVFLSAGEYEIENGIRLPTEAMIRTLEGRGYRGLVLTTHLFPEETHESALPGTISRGLRAVFGTWPRSDSDDG